MNDLKERKNGVTKKIDLKIHHMAERRATFRGGVEVLMTLHNPPVSATRKDNGERVEVKFSVACKVHILDQDERPFDAVELSRMPEDVLKLFERAGESLLERIDADNPSLKNDPPKR